MTTTYSYSHQFKRYYLTPLLWFTLLCPLTWAPGGGDPGCWRVCGAQRATVCWSQNSSAETFTRWRHAAQEPCKLCLGIPASFKIMKCAPRLTSLWSFRAVEWTDICACIGTDLCLSLGPLVFSIYLKSNGKQIGQKIWIRALEMGNIMKILRAAYIQLRTRRVPQCGAERPTLWV